MSSELNPIVCWNCREVGHHSNKCPTLINDGRRTTSMHSMNNCTNCGGFNHHANMCTNKKQHIFDASITCYNCQQRGHKVADCHTLSQSSINHVASRINTRCYKCNVVGHYRNNCPSQ